MGRIIRFTILIGLLSFTAALVAATFIESRTGSAAKHWQQVAAVVKSASVEKKETTTLKGRPIYAYIPHVLYDYTYQSKPFECDIISFPNPGNLSRSAATSLVNQCVPGTKIQAYVNPDHPEIACIVTGPNDVFMLHCAICGMAVASWIYFFVRKFLNPKRKETLAQPIANTLE